MARPALFWRVMAIVAVLHAAALFGLLRWSNVAREKVLSTPKIRWLDATAAALEQPSPPPDEPPLQPTPAAAEEATVVEEESSPPPSLLVPAPEPAAIETPAPSPSPVTTSVPSPSPTATASATPTPRPKPTPSPTPRRAATPKPSPEKSPRKKPRAKEPKTRATPKPKPKTAASPTPTARPAEEKAPAENRRIADNPQASASNAASGKAASEFAWYGRMLHDRFFSAWNQPTSVISTGAKMSALARVRIEPDGRVSAFRIIRSSGNIIVDESVAAVAKRVTRVDPLPAGLGGRPYEVNINFELNPKE